MEQFSSLRRRNCAVRRCHGGLPAWWPGLLAGDLRHWRRCRARARLLPGLRIDRDRRGGTHTSGRSGSSLAIIVPTSIRSYTAHKARPRCLDMEVLRSFNHRGAPSAVVARSADRRLYLQRGLRAIFAAIMILVGVASAFQNRESWRTGRRPGGQFPPAR